MKNVLFVCVENSCRSQMAEGFAKYFGQGKVEAYSAGSKPSGRVNPLAVIVMKEVGVDISEQMSKGFDDLPVKTFDCVVTMGCGDICPLVPAKAYMNWDIEDPKNKDIVFLKRIRDTIRENVESLIQ